MNSFETIDFESNTQYEFLKNNYSSNSVFKIPFWKPDSIKPCTEVLIMINGFLEGVDNDTRIRNRHINRYDAIAKKIQSEKNIAVLLMPMPFHFDRSVDINGQNEFAPLQRLTENGAFLYYGGYDQIIVDVSKIIFDIENDPSKYGVTVNSEIKFHLLGYSLGGVAAIGSALNLEKSATKSLDKITPKLESLVILLSAWNISEINPEAIQNAFGEKFGLTVDKWEKLLSQLTAIKESTTLDFRKLIWDEGEPINFSKCAKRVFFLHGFKDDIFTSIHTENSRKQVIGVMDKCTFINLPSDHHAIRSREVIAGYVSSFICNG